VGNGRPAQRAVGLRSLDQEPLTV